MPLTGDITAVNTDPALVRTFEDVLADANAVGKSTPELAAELVFQALVTAVYNQLPELALSQLGDDVNVRAQIGLLLRTNAITVTVTL